jgi:hypothetical protein
MVSHRAFLPLLGRLMRPGMKVDPKRYPKYKTADLLPFEGHRRDVDRFQLLFLEQLRAQDTMPAVESDARTWKRVFAAMDTGVELAVDMDAADKPSYKRVVAILSGRAIPGAAEREGDKMERRNKITNKSSRHSILLSLLTIQHFLASNAHF